MDKTSFVAAVLDPAARVKLFPRPRRFGKTLNMSTARWFLERGQPDVTPLFEDTWIWWAEDGRYRTHFQRYPVLWLSFKDVKARTWEHAWVSIRRLLVREIRRLDAMGHLNLDTTPDMAAVLRLGRDEGAPLDFEDFLERVPQWCAAASGQPCIILIDEYDTPLITAWEHGYQDEAVDFFRAFLPAGLKDAPHARAAALTGILRVAKESLFSGLNHVATHSVLSSGFPDIFGFTEDEVGELVQAADQDATDAESLRRWYNGYRSGAGQAVTVYNPWSILSYLQRPADGPGPHWVNTGDHALVRHLLMRQAAEVGRDVEELMAGGTLTRHMEDHVALQQLDRSPDALWHLLLYAGYLTPERIRRAADGRLLVDLRVPNLEVRSAFRSIFEQLLTDATVGSANVRSLTHALLAGDAAQFEEILELLLVKLLSFHDVARVSDRPVEAVYQAFILGLLVHLDGTHRVQSNREAGFGRADILVIPRTAGPGAVLELKSVHSRRNESVEAALESAAHQLLERDYASEVSAHGATTVHQMAVVFDGKRCWARAVGR